MSEADRNPKIMFRRVDPLPTDHHTVEGGRAVVSARETVPNLEDVGEESFAKRTSRIPDGKPFTLPIPNPGDEPIVFRPEPNTRA